MAHTARALQYSAVCMHSSANLAALLNSYPPFIAVQCALKYFVGAPYRVDDLNWLVIAFAYTNEYFGGFPSHTFLHAISCTAGFI